MLPAPIFADWIDANWPFRRAVDVSWESASAPDGDLAVADAFCAGHCLPDGSDIRVATSDNRYVPSHVLMMGPGDRVRVVFQLVKPVTRYYIYFGNPHPTPPRAGLADVNYDRGLLAEMRVWTGGGVDNFNQVQSSWERSQPVLGRTFLEKAFIGFNPFGMQEQTIMKMTGEMFAPLDGEYSFAMSARDRGALFIDGQPVLFCAQQVNDVRINARQNLKKGTHGVTLFQVDEGGQLRLSVVWQLPNSRVWSIFDRNAFGFVFRAKTGAMEELRHTLTADFSAENEGECFFEDEYSKRIHFVATLPRLAVQVSCEWDFGDGQSSTSTEVQHVYLADGIYPVKLTLHAAGNSDTQTIRLAISRDWEHLDQATEDDLAMHVRMVGTYDLARLPAGWMPRLGWMGVKAGEMKLMLTGCRAVAAAPHHADAGNAMAMLIDATLLAAEKGQDAAAMDLWDLVPGNSDLQPMAADYYGRLLLWRVGDIAKALGVLQPQAGGPTSDGKRNDIKRTYAQALLLAHKVDEARKYLSAIPPEGDLSHEAAISGASARTVEYYITQGDWETGEKAWNAWQARYPADFLEGYGALLKVRLMELKKNPEAAAKVAEAFATAMPNSPYAPQLLDKASKLTADSDPSRSQRIRRLLKERYPEDPLSQ